MGGFEAFHSSLQSVAKGEGSVVGEERLQNRIRKERGHLSVLSFSMLGSAGGSREASTNNTKERENLF